MLAIIFAIICFVGWAVGDILNTIASRRLNGYSVAFWVNAIGLLLALPYAPFVLKDLEKMPLPIFLLTIFFGALLTIGFASFTEGVKKGSAALVGAISGSFPALV